MKLPPLLAEYLYTHKRLDLSGIGSFLLEPSIDVVADQAKSGKQTINEGISFESNTEIRESPELISFIADTTGKIKALAAADLNSHLELARQILHIGKPFLFEGIGSLSKLQAGQFSFTPGAILKERVKETVIKESIGLQDAEETGGEFKNIFYGRKIKHQTKKILAISLLMGGIVFAIWGGYTVNKKNTAKNNEAPAGEKSNDEQDNEEKRTVATNDTTSIINDSAASISTDIVAPGNYKFVVETADKVRGLKRYGLLKGFGLDVKMETRDSVRFNIYFLLPALPSDTARLLDSLKFLYTPPGAKSFVEK